MLQRVLILVEGRAEAEKLTCGPSSARSGNEQSHNKLLTEDFSRNDKEVTYTDADDDELLVLKI